VSRQAQLGDAALSDALGTTGDPSDVHAVRQALGFAPALPIPPRELAGLASAWLNASMVLRANDLPRTTATLAGMVACGTGFAAAHARRLIEILSASPANDIDFYDGAMAAAFGADRAPRKVRRPRR
jgi:hypothetical protein